MTYGFRIRFQQGADGFTSTQGEAEVAPGGPKIKPVGRSTFNGSDALALSQGGFASIEEARKAGELWFDAILVAGLRMRRGFDLGRFRLGGGLTPDGVAHFSKGGRSARDDIHGLDVFEDGDHAFVSLSAEASVTSGIEKLLEHLRASKRIALFAEDLRLALELFGLARLARSPRVHFLTLVSAVEVLAERRSLDDATAALVDGWVKSLPPKLAADDSFANRLRDLKTESIARACWRLVDSRLGSDAARAFKKLYGLRSTLLHEGAVDGTDFVSEAAETEELVVRLLSSIVDGSQ